MHPHRPARVESKDLPMTWPLTGVLFPFLPPRGGVGRGGVPSGDNGDRACTRRAKGLRQDGSVIRRHGFGGT